MPITIIEKNEPTREIEAQKFAPCDKTIVYGGSRRNDERAALISIIKNRQEEIIQLKAENKRLKEERRWIPTSERLPVLSEYRERGTRELIPILVCVKGTEYPFRAMYDGKNWGDGISIIEVTHWQPLPQPPEESEGRTNDRQGIA